LHVIQRVLTTNGYSSRFGGTIISVGQMLFPHFFALKYPERFHSFFDKILTFLTAIFDAWNKS
jgi:hypothetical protein